MWETGSDPSVSAGSFPFLPTLTSLHQNRVSKQHTFLARRFFPLLEDLGCRCSRRRPMRADDLFQISGYDNCGLLCVPDLTTDIPPTR